MWMCGSMYFIIHLPLSSAVCCGLIVDEVLAEFRGRADHVCSPGRRPPKSAVPGVFEVIARHFAEGLGPERVCDAPPQQCWDWLCLAEQVNNTNIAHTAP